MRTLLFACVALTISGCLVGCTPGISDAVATIVPPSAISTVEPTVEITKPVIVTPVVPKVVVLPVVPKVVVLPVVPKVVPVAKVKLPVVPPNSIPLFPSLLEAINIEWPAMQTRSIFAGQIEQESCISLTSKGCWNPRTELKTSREYGFGLGQITIAYNATGGERFNNFTGSKKQFPQLASWKWENRYDPTFQMRTIILMDKNLYNGARWDIANETEHYAFMLASYNGGLGGTMKDRTLCLHTKGCDPEKWFGNVALYSFKARTKLHGYGQSFYEINRGYVDQIMNKRRLKYIPYMEKSPE